MDTITNHSANVRKLAIRSPITASLPDTLMSEPPTDSTATSAPSHAIHLGIIPVRRIPADTEPTASAVPIATIEEHFKTVAACHLANVSLQAGRKLFWDPQKELCFKDAEKTILDPVANKHLSREYRKGYELPQV